MGLAPDLLYAVTRIRTTFADDVGNVKQGTGTGFWVHAAAHPYPRMLATNRHNLDPSMLFPELPGLRLWKTEIELGERKLLPPDHARHSFREIDPASPRLLHDTADCALLPWPRYSGSPATLPPAFAAEFIASKSWLVDAVQLTDFATFISFAGLAARDGRPAVDWWDTANGLPIARLATIASHPWSSFQNHRIRTSHVGLVAGLSFNGASGSPLILHERGVGPESEHHVPTQLIGIMTGHFHWLEETDDMFKHSGLSYYTNSDALLDLMALANALPRPDPEDRSLLQ